MQALFKFNIVHWMEFNFMEIWKMTIERKSERNLKSSLLGWLEDVLLVGVWEFDWWWTVRKFKVQTDTVKIL